ncbi:MAG: hypothetical protein IJV22_04950 [Bacteroidales bacterium]|nr:hypothetical protein [Bacteroidales bacterium]
MKKQHFHQLVLSMLTLLAVGMAPTMSAQRIAVQQLKSNFQEVHMRGNSSLTIRQAEDCAIQIQLDGDSMASDIAKQKGDILYINSTTPVVLTVNPGQLTLIRASDNSSVVIADSLDMSMSAKLLASSNASIRASKIHATNINIEGRNNGAINISSHLNADSMALTTMHNAVLTVQDVKGNALSAWAYNNSKITIKEGVLNERYRTSAVNNASLDIHVQAPDHIQSRTFSEGDTLIDHLVDVMTSPKRTGNGASVSIDDRGNLHFLWGFTNWGDSPVNGLSKLDGGYNLRTSFSSYQFEYTYSFVQRRHLLLSAGAGYESDVYKFASPYVALTPGAQGTFGEVDASGIAAAEGVSATFADANNWNTRLVARYVYIPIRVGFRTNNKVHMGISLLPGLCYNGRHTGLKHRIEEKRSNYHQSVDNNIGKYMQPYKLDVRFDVGWENLRLFVQMACVPVLTDMDKKVYPIKVGIEI